MNTTPKALRLHIGIFGRVNVGKSSFLNMLTGQSVAITSPVEGTTTDTVEKAMELLPIGPVLFLDTAGIDDKSDLGHLRVKKARKEIGRSDIVVLIIEAGVFGEYEESVLKDAKDAGIPVILAVNKSDLLYPTDKFLMSLRDKVNAIVIVSSLDFDNRDKYVNEFKSALINLLPDDFIKSPPLLSDLVRPGKMCVLVVPIDMEAPKGRLILPQVQVIRDVLDNDSLAVVVKEGELSFLLKNGLAQVPDLVVCDSQVVLKVSADVPSHIKMTTFSILFSRYKGDLAEAAKGAAVIDKLKRGDKILIAEACTHHAIEDDIARVKIPRWIRQYLGWSPEIDMVSGKDYPDNLAEYKLVIHCGACMLNRRQMLHRIHLAKKSGLAITNYGVAISLLQGVLDRVLSPFPLALEAYNEAREGD